MNNLRKRSLKRSNLKYLDTSRNRSTVLSIGQNSRRSSSQEKLFSKPSFASKKSYVSLKCLHAIYGCEDGLELTCEYRIEKRKLDQFLVTPFGSSPCVYSFTDESVRHILPPSEGSAAVGAHTINLCCISCYRTLYESSANSPSPSVLYSTSTSLPTCTASPTATSPSFGILLLDLSASLSPSTFPLFRVRTSILLTLPSSVYALCIPLRLPSSVYVPFLPLPIPFSV